MKIAIFSDIHGNLEALQTVLEQCSARGADRVVCLGDLVGYGADPNACVEAVSRATGTVLAGNHDWAAVGLEDARFFNPLALAAIRWTEKQLTDENREYLKSRPLTVEEEGGLYVHASPYRPEAWRYLFCPDEGRLDLAYTEARMCFVGHSHHAFICAETGDAEVLGEGAMPIEASDRYLVNVGSVGQPRDGDPRASFALWDRAASRLQVCRVPYDVKTAQAKIRAARLPDLLADRLAVGR